MFLLVTYKAKSVLTLSYLWFPQFFKGDHFFIIQWIMKLQCTDTIEPIDKVRNINVSMVNCHWKKKDNPFDNSWFRRLTNF